MLLNGKWKPTAIPKSKYRRSRQISSMYSPVGMLSWYELYQIYLDAQLDPDGMRSFTNLYRGLPFKESGSRPDFNKVIEQRGAYASRDIPDGVLYLTVGIDVQRGSDEPKNNNPARLEMEVLGTGIGYRSWSIEYKIFTGSIDDAFSGAWEKMYEWAKEGGLTYKRADGVEFTPQLIFIDSGDGPYIDTVYSFVSRWPNTFPSKGFSILKKRKDEKIGDEVMTSNFIRYRAAKTPRSMDVLFYEIATNYYKTRVYNNLKIQRIPEKLQRPGFCDFPRDYPENYFKMLTAEEKHSDGSFHAHGRRNESLDCRVMALCAGDVFLDAKVAEMKQEMKQAAKTSGATVQQMAVVNSRFILNIMTRNTARREVKGK
jgi:phage terminase large subunit GpA-like protein